MTERLVGTVGVDAGVVWVGDPCYVVGPDGSHSPKNWAEFCDAVFTDENKRAPGVVEPMGEGVGFAIDSGEGDGTYPVYVSYNGNGTVTGIRIAFGEDFSDPEMDSYDSYGG